MVSNSGMGFGVKGSPRKDQGEGISMHFEHSEFPGNRGG